MPAVPSTVSLTEIANGANINSSPHRNNYSAIQTALNAVIEILNGGTNGQVLQRGASDPEWGGDFAAYTPVWTASSGDAPAIGNGTLVGRYARLGELVVGTVELTAGGTTTFGNGGAWRFTLPVTAAGNIVHGNALLLDASGSNYPADCSLITSTTFQVAPWDTSGSFATLSSVNNTSPFTWVSTDGLRALFVYEAA